MTRSSRLVVGGHGGPDNPEEQAEELMRAVGRMTLGRPSSTPCLQDRGDDVATPRRPTECCIR